MPNLAEANICVGCSACANICPKRCIEMKKDSDGFSYPVIMYATNCIECGMCETVCPVLNQNIRTHNNLSSAYAAFSVDESIRLDSSSGGVFTELAKIIISQSGVVYGAAYDDLFEVYHYCVDNIEEIYKLRGAKYSESNLGNSFQDILERLKKGQQVLFSGTPCQVAGLKAFIGEDFDNLICIDFVCHGVPSPMVWSAYIKYRSQNDANGEMPSRINLRSKSTGWSKYQYSNVFEYKGGIKHSVLSSRSLFMKLFIGDYISRDACSTCKFKGYDRVSDITLGDFWGIWDLDLDMDDNKGTSVILVHSNKGELLWKAINPQIKCKRVSLEQASRQNPSMLMASNANTNRSYILAKIRAGEIDICEELFETPQNSMLSKLKMKIRCVLQGE